jgi:hypothetical protein
VTDDTVAIQAALDAQSGNILDGGGLSYAMTSSADLTDRVTLQNCTLFYSGSSCLRATQDFVRSDNLSTDAAFGTNTATIADTSAYSAGDIIKISSDNVWTDDGNVQVTSGEMLEVSEVTSGTVLTFSTSLNENYTTADSAKIELVDNAISNVRLSNVRIVGNDPEGTQHAVVTARVRGVTIENCQIEDSGYSGVYLEDVFGFSVIENSFTNISNSSQGYCVSSYSASRFGQVKGNKMFKCRTGYTHGGTTGVGYNIIASDNIVLSCVTAGINSKASSDGMVVCGNHVEGENSGAGLGDGIRMRGRNPVITGNYITNCHRYSIYTPIYGAGSNNFGSVNITGNSVSGARDIACFVEVNDGGAVKGVVINGNNFRHIDDTSTSKGSINIRSYDGSIDNISVVGNAVSNCPYNCLDVRTDGTGTISNYVATGNVLERNATAIAAGRQAIVTTGPTNNDTTGNITV